MAVTQVYTAVANDVITAARWNNEFGNIYNNGTDIAFPLTKAVSLAGYTLTLDNAGNSTIVSPGTSGLNLTAGAKTGTPAVSLGANLNIAASTFTDSATAGSGTATSFAANAVQRPTLAASNASVLCTDAATWYIANSPANGSNETITNPWALWVDDGNVRFDGNLVVKGELIAAGQAPHQLTAVCAANALTITLLNGAGVSPSASYPVPLSFRSATDTTGARSTVNVTAATSLVISSGSTLGTVSNIWHRIWIGAINNGGTVELFAHNAVAMPAVSSFPQTLAGPSVNAPSTHTVISTIAEGGAGAADSAQVSYSTNARSNKAFVWLGYFESQQGTAGTWTTAPARIHVYQKGDPLPGQVLQSKKSIDTAVATGTTVLPIDNTTPAITEGDQYMSVSATPTSLMNLFHVNVLFFGTHSAGARCGVTLNDGSATLCAGALTIPAAGTWGIGILDYWGFAPTGATNYNVRAGSTSAGTTTFNGEAGAVRQNVTYSHVIVEEIMG